MRRLAIGGAALALLVVSGAGAAGGRLTIKSVDAGSYPLIELVAVSPKANGKPPRLRENGRPVPGLEAASLGKEKAVVVAIDRSRSMRGRPIFHAARAARRFIAAKPSSDRIELVVFGSRALALTGFSGSAIDVDTALRTLGVDDVQGTALYDAVVLAAADLRREALPGKVLVVLTDGANRGGSATLGQAIGAARAAGVVVYPIAIASKQLAVAPLRRLARATGGSFHAAASSGALTDVYVRVARELRRTWRLSYATAARPGAELRLDVRQPGVGTASARTTVPGDPAAPPRQLLPGSLLGQGFSAVLVALAAALLLFAAWRIAMRRPTGEDLRQRLAAHVGGASENANEPRRSFRPRLQLGAVTAATDERLARLRQWRRLAGLLERAAVPLRPAELLYLGLALGVAFALLAAVTMGSAVAIVLVFALGAGGPILFVWIKAKRRVRAFDEQLPDLLASVSASLKAGHSFRQGLKGVVEQVGPPASVEFGRVLAETRLGRPLDEALDAMCERVGSEDLQYVASAVSVQEQVGGSMAGLFEIVSDTVRERQQHARKVRSLTAMGRASAYVLTALPFVMAGLITFINPGYMQPLYSTTTGHFLIGLGLSMIFVGALLLKKIVTIRG
jgi:tight adherence protein B